MRCLKHLFGGSSQSWMTMSLHVDSFSLEELALFFSFAASFKVFKSSCLAHSNWAPLNSSLCLGSNEVATRNIVWWSVSPGSVYFLKRPLSSLSSNLLLCTPLALDSAWRWRQMSIIAGIQEDKVVKGASLHGTLPTSVGLHDVKEASRHGTVLTTYHIDQTHSDTSSNIFLLWTEKRLWFNLHSFLIAVWVLRGPRRRRQYVVLGKFTVCFTKFWWLQAMEI